MQKDYDKYGDVFACFILETDIHPIDKLAEYKYIKKYNSYIREYGYNYKDHLAKKIIFGKPGKAVKTEAEILTHDSCEKREYISEILELLNKTEDIALIDFVFQLLRKSGINK